MLAKCITTYVFKIWVIKKELLIGLFLLALCWTILTVWSQHFHHLKNLVTTL